MHGLVEELWKFINTVTPLQIFIVLPQNTSVKGNFQIYSKCKAKEINLLKGSNNCPPSDRNMDIFDVPQCLVSSPKL